MVEPAQADVVVRLEGAWWIIFYKGFEIGRIAFQTEQRPDVDDNIRIAAQIAQTIAHQQGTRGIDIQGSKAMIQRFTKVATQPQITIARRM